MLKNPLHHEIGLILLSLARDESRLGAIAFHRAQFLRMALWGEANDAIGDVEDRLGGAIVGFERGHRRAGKFGGEIENVAHFGGAEAVYALRIVTHDGKVAIERPHAMENGELQPVGVLIFVHEDVIEPFVRMVEAIGTVDATVVDREKRRGVSLLSPRRDCGETRPSDPRHPTDPSR